MRVNIVFFLFVASLTLGCGSSTQRRPPTNDVQAGASLMAALQNIETSKTTDAKVTFAVFGGPELADGDALNAVVNDVVTRTAGRRLPRRHQPFIVTHPNNAELPLDVSALAEAVGPLGATIRQAQHVAFVRYVGKPQRAHRQIQLVLATIAEVARSENVIVDISTRRAYVPSDFDELRLAKDWLSRQVTPGAERSDDAITFFSRGMIKLGLPDLEKAQVPPEQARAAFERFQSILTMMQSRKSVRVGDKIDDVTLIACRRSPEAIEGQCVALP